MAEAGRHAPTEANTPLDKRKRSPRVALRGQARVFCRLSTILYKHCLRFAFYAACGMLKGSFEDVVFVYERLSNRQHLMKPVPRVRVYVCVCVCV